MNRNEIYDHLAQVYLGKKKKAVKTEKAQKKYFSAWLIINILITVLVFASTFYGLTAFWQHQDLTSNIVYSLHKGSIRISYNFKNSSLPEKTFAMDLPQVNASKYGSLNFSVRAKEEGNPGILKIILSNRLNEQSYYYVQNVDYKWKEISIPFAEFKNISDWTNVKDLAVVLESWNVDNPKGMILIDDLRFAGGGNSASTIRDINGVNEY